MRGRRSLTSTCVSCIDRLRVEAGATTTWCIHESTLKGLRQLVFYGIGPARNSEKNVYFRPSPAPWLFVSHPSLLERKPLRGRPLARNLVWEYWFNYFRSVLLSTKFLFFSRFDIFFYIGKDKKKFVLCKSVFILQWFKKKQN